MFPLQVACLNPESGRPADSDPIRWEGSFRYGFAMRAVLLTGHGGLEKLEYREDVPTLEPAEGEILIAVGAAGINNTDIWT